MGLSEVQRAPESGAWDGATLLLFEGDEPGMDLRERQAAIVRELEGRLADYGRAEFNAGRADATEYVRAQMFAETCKDRLLDLCWSVINGEGSNADHRE